MLHMRLVAHNRGQSCNALHYARILLRDAKFLQLGDLLCR